MVRYKKRYFLVQFTPISSNAFPEQKFTLNQILRDKINELFGDYGLGAASCNGGLRTLQWTPDIGIGIFQSRHEAREYLGAAIPFLTDLRGVKAVPRLLYTGATIRHCKMALEAYLKNNENITKLDWS
ncbi:uncharacterized protein Pop5 [Lepeophtheirus salmonis]|uniref:uncharacterized protein Pop5 n=1 Tax=Lepeophtheirus salmonis TaxID=72036 RepID=UPI001AEA8397|nr:ribonuclease P/MRP protein subunit POP5-like [Lepeophtheirus salmonis]